MHVYRLEQLQFHADKIVFVSVACISIVARTTERIEDTLLRFSLNELNVKSLLFLLHLIFDF